MYSGYNTPPQPGYGVPPQYGPNGEPLGDGDRGIGKALLIGAGAAVAGIATYAVASKITSKRKKKVTTQNGHTREVDCDVLVDTYGNELPGQVFDESGRCVNENEVLSRAGNQQQPQQQQYGYPEQQQQYGYPQQQYGYPQQPMGYPQQQYQPYPPQQQQFGYPQQQFGYPQQQFGYPQQQMGYPQQQYQPYPPQQFGGGYPY